MHRSRSLRIITKYQCQCFERKTPQNAGVSVGWLSNSSFSTSSWSPPPPKNDGNQRNDKSSPRTSVSQEEVTKFSNMARLWWQPRHNPLISMNPTRMNFITMSILSHFQRQSTQEVTHNHWYEPLKNLIALDVGCGGGLTSESLARLGAKVTGVDPSVEVAKAAEDHSRLDEKTIGIRYRGGLSVEGLVKESIHGNGDLHHFDVITILEVIEHATDPDSLIQAASMLLKKPEGDYPGGIIFVSTINKTLKSFGIAIVGGEYITGKLPIGTHNWNQFKSPQDVEILMNQYGLEKFDTKGMILKPPFYDLKWYLDDTDTDVNWIGAYRFKNRLVKDGGEKKD